jgi:site-specific recombinase XerD
MPRGTRRRRLPKVLTEAEAEALVGKVGGGKSATGLRNRAMLYAMLRGGLRVSEVCYLRPADVDLAQGQIRVNDGKGSVDRVVPIDGETRAVLQAWATKREAEGHNGRRAFFCTVRKGSKGTSTITRPTEGRPHPQAPPAGALSPVQLERMVRLAAEAAGIQDVDPETGRHKVTCHTLRHTYATRQLRAGFNIREVQDLLGHSNVATTQVYTHVDPQALREKVQGQKAADPQVAKLAEALAAMPAEARAALLEALQVGGE